MSRMRKEAFITSVGASLDPTLMSFSLQSVSPQTVLAAASKVKDKNEKGELSQVKSAALIQSNPLIRDKFVSALLSLITELFLYPK